MCLEINRKSDNNKIKKTYTSIKSKIVMMNDLVFRIRVMPVKKQSMEIPCA